MDWGAQQQYINQQYAQQAWKNSKTSSALGKHAMIDWTFSQLSMDKVENYRKIRGVFPSAGRAEVAGYPAGDVEAFNRYGTIFADDEASTSLGYVFMVRPDLNLLSDGYQLYDQATTTPFIEYLLHTDPNIIRSLTYGWEGAQNLHHFIPLLYDRVDEYQITDVEIVTHEMVQPFSGFKTIYGGNSNGTMSGCSFEIGFRDTAKLRVTKLFQLWVSYINGIAMNYFAPKDQYLYSKYTSGAQVIDYATSIYFIRTRPDGEIIFFHKVTGAFPTKVPLNFQSFNRGSNPDPKVTVTFVGGYPESMNPITMGEFNYNATNGTFQVSGIAKNYDSLGYGGSGYTGDTMTGAPIILDRQDGARHKYFLAWQVLNRGGVEYADPYDMVVPG